MSGFILARLTGSSTHTAGTAAPPAIRRRSAWALIVVASAALATGIWVYTANTRAVQGIVGWELNTAEPFGRPLRPAVRTAVKWDFAFIGGYTIALAIGLFLIQCVARSALARRLAYAGMAAAALVVVADCLENTFLLTGLRDAAAVSATLKFALLPFAVLAALLGVGLTAIRTITNSPSQLRRWVEHEVGFWPPRPVEGDDNSASPFPSPEPEKGARWLAGFDLPPEMAWERPWIEGSGPTGFCLSGGGVRAASVSLGALETLRPQLLSADYLVSVSGGGYTAGAFAQALTGAQPPASGGAVPPPEILRDARTAFIAGSVSEEHIRLRAAYLANTPWELTKALLVLLRHMVLSLYVLFAPAVILGIAAGWFYKRIPVNFFEFANPPGSSPGFTSHRITVAVDPLPYVPIAAGVIAVGVAVLWLMKQRVLTQARAQLYRRVSDTLKVTMWLLAGFLTVTVALPLVVVLANWALLGHSWSKPVSVGGSIAGPVLAYLATLASVAWKKRKIIAGVSATTNGTKDGTEPAKAQVPKSLTQRLLVLGTLVLVAAIWLIVFAAGVRTYGGHPALWTALGLAVGVVILGGVVDETTLSLHSFYRKRIAHTFATRTVRRGDGQVVAAGYDFGELTALSEYGAVASGVEFPKLTFAATANVNDADRTPPGRTGLSYTLSADWVGGPDVGWMRTKDMQRLAPPKLTGDLTVQGAVAVSGAAFAAAMGDGGRAYQVLLAITGARLGSWLPNPCYLHDALNRAAADDWLVPRLPRSRSMVYLLREVVNSHPHSDRLLHTTDGGHYDNLGLIELLRRRCRTIYCIDASGDSPPMAETLAEAIARAYTELGVRIDVGPDEFDLEPGTAETLTTAPGLQNLQNRLSRSPILTARITYPPQSGLATTDGGDVEGRLIVAKAALWSDLPYSLLAYATRHPEFPHDTTGDQFFDADQFSAYVQLGRELGNEIVEIERLGRVPGDVRQFAGRRVRVPS